MYSRGARERTSSGPEGMKSTSSTNLRFRAKPKTKTLRTKAREVKLKQQQSKSRLKRATSRLKRALVKSYDITETVTEEGPPSMLKVVNIKHQTSKKGSSHPIKKRLSVNETGCNSVERPLTLVTQTPKWKIEEKRRKANMDILTTMQKSTFEEMNTETKESFGRLTPNIVSLKMQLNQEFNTSIDEQIRRRSSADSDDSFVELNNGGRAVPVEDPGFELSELAKGRNASKLLRTEQNLELVKKALHNGFRLKQEAKAKRMREQRFDEEFFAKKSTKKHNRKSAVRRLFNKASRNVKSNVSSITKRLSKGATTLSMRLSSDKHSSSKDDVDEELDLDDPNTNLTPLTPKNLKKLQMLIAKNDVEKVTFKLNQQALEKESSDELIEPQIIKPVKRVNNKSSEVAAQKFKEKMEEKRKMSLVDRKRALRMRRQKHSAKVTHSNVAKLEELRQQKLRDLETGASSRRTGNRLHTRRVLYKRRDRSGLSSKRISDIEDASSMSDSEVSTDSLVELANEESKEEVESIESLIEEGNESVESLVEEDVESIDSLVEEEVESLVEEDNESLVEVPANEQAVEDSGSVIELVSIEDDVTLEVNSLLELSKRQPEEVEDSDSDSEDGSLIISNAFRKKTVVRQNLGDSLIDLTGTGSNSSPRELLEDSRNRRAVASKPKQTTKSRDKSKKQSDQTRRGTIEGDELPSITVRKRHPKATQRLSNKRLNF